jgi:hypothetical protein
MPDICQRIAEEAARESPLWREALRPPASREYGSVFSQLGPRELALGVETIYEGYLAHYGRSRLFAPADSDLALLLGDYLYASGLVRIAASGSASAVAELSRLLSHCAHLRAEGLDGDGPLWAATVAQLGRGGIGEAEAAFERTRDCTPLLDLARDGVGNERLEHALAEHAERFK